MSNFVPLFYTRRVEKFQNYFSLLFWIFLGNHFCPRFLTSTPMIFTFFCKTNFEVVEKAWEIFDIFWGNSIFINNFFCILFYFDVSWSKNLVWCKVFFFSTKLKAFIFSLYLNSFIFSFISSWQITELELATTIYDFIVTSSIILVLGSY